MQRLAEFFAAKGLAALKAEDRAGNWHADWIRYQGDHGLLAGVLSPRAYSTRGTQFDLLNLTRFWEATSYFSPAHAYSLHVSFLGLFPILRGGSEALKREAVAMLEAGGIFAFGVSERDHGADLLANEFAVTEVAPGRLSARGSKYYIGNANAAAMVSVLAKRTRGHHRDGASRRAPLLFFAMRPADGNGAVRDVRKIQTSGIRTAYVAAFDVDGYEFPESDVICHGRQAWDTVFATVNLGKFFLGFGSIGMCEHALEETAAHTRGRVLYGKPVAGMPHIRAAMAHAYAKLAAMKLFAYRALDYLHAANAADRRYLLFAAVQKARVSTEGVKVMALLSECMGARGCEADTYFESALRDAPLVPTLEGSTHINHQMVAQFTAAYFARRPGSRPAPPDPPSLAVLGAAAGENPYLMESLTDEVQLVAFGDFLDAYRPLAAVPNVALFARQVRAFRLFLLRGVPVEDPKQDAEVVIALGKCLSIIAYAQLVAEHCTLADAPAAMVNVLFHQSVEDLGLEAMHFASLPQSGVLARLLLGRIPAVPRTRSSDLEHVAGRVDELA